jgi:hypothetical protein
MRTFDANCRIGRYNRWSGREPVTACALLETMDPHGLHEALVVDNIPVECHAADGSGVRL